MRLRMRTIVVLAAVLAATVAMMGAPAQAATTDALCTAKADVKITPGISATPTKGTFASLPGGQINCVGQVNGVQVGGPGTLSFSGSYGTVGAGDTCNQGAGKGSLTAKVKKVSGGLMKVLGTFSFTRAGADVIVTGKLGGATLRGDLAFIPTKGNCETVKVTKATVAGAAEANS
jgi:hypothetical protein